MSTINHFNTPDELSIKKFTTGMKIIVRKTKDNQIKEQYATIDHIHDDGTIEYNYGYFGFHEGFCVPNQIRSMTDTEKQYLNNNQWWNLPQQFYQSFPQ